MPRDIMSEQQINIKFVKEVKKHPTLYNFELPTYSRKDLTDQAWAEVGEATNMTPSACRERWRNLRAVFMRTIKARSNRMGTKKPYYLANVMHFVVPYLRPLVMAKAAREKELQEKKLQEKELQEKEALETVQAETSQQVVIEIQNIKVENEEDMEEFSTQSPNEEIDTKNRTAQDEEHRQTNKAGTSAQPSLSVVPKTTDIEHVKSFLNSLVPELTELNSVQFKNFKRRVLILIDDITEGGPPSHHTADSDSDYII